MSEQDEIKKLTKEEIVKQTGSDKFRQKPNIEWNDRPYHSIEKQALGS